MELDWRDRRMGYAYGWLVSLWSSDAVRFKIIRAFPQQTLLWLIALQQGMTQSHKAVKAGPLAQKERNNYKPEIWRAFYQVYEILFIRYLFNLSLSMFSFMLVRGIHDYSRSDLLEKTSPNSNRMDRPILTILKNYLTRSWKKIYTFSFSKRKQHLHF